MGIEGGDKVESQSQYISPFFAVFKDVNKENSFRQEVLLKQRRLVFRLCLFVTIAMPVFMLSDYMVVKPEPWSTFLPVSYTHLTLPTTPYV